MEWGIVSYIIRYYFNPCGTGSHLYTANTNTLRSAHWVEDLLALVGTHISWSPHPPLLYPYCITTQGICQEGFLKNRNLFQKPFSYFSSAVAVHQILVILYPKGLALLVEWCSLLTSLVYHIPHQKSSVISKIFSQHLLTQCPGEMGELSSTLASYLV